MTTATPTKAWIVTILLFFYTVVNFFDKLVIGLAAVPIMKEMHLSPGQYGMVASSFYTLYAVSGIAFGLFVVNRMRSKTLLLLLVLIWTVAQLPIAMTSSLWVLVACRVLLGVGEGPGTPSAFHTCYGWFPSERRNLPTAIILQGAGVGFLIGAPILTQIIVAFGWRAAFLVCAGLGVLWLVAWLAFGGDGPLTDAPELPGTDAASSSRVPWATFWTDPTMLGCLLVGFASYWLAGLSIAWLAPYLQLALGYDAKTAGWLVSLVVGAQPPFILLLSYVSHRLLRGGVSSRMARGAMNGTCVLAGGAALLAATMVGDNVLHIVLLAAGFVLPQMTFVLGPAIVGEIAPSAQRGPAILVTYSVITFAGFLSPAVTGRLIDAAGRDHAGAGYAQAFLMTAVILIAGGIAGLALLDPERTLRRFAAPPTYWRRTRTSPG
jgi:MFS family permease